MKHAAKINTDKCLLWVSGAAAILLCFGNMSVFSALVCLGLCALLYVHLRKAEPIRITSLFQTSYLTSACILSALAGRRFYECVRTLDVTWILSKRLGIGIRQITLVLACIGCTAAIVFLSYLSSLVCRYLRDNHREKLETARHTLADLPRGGVVIILLTVYAIALFPLLRANVNYIDDNGRAFGGYTGWYNFSRFLADYLAYPIHCGDLLTDISPLPQLLAMVIMAFASIAVIQAFKGGDEGISLWDLIAVLPLGLYPYFLENLSYKFDAPYMAISVLASVVPLLFRHKRVPYLFAAFAGTMAVCMTYQAGLGIFPMAVVFLAFSQWYKKERSTQQVLLFVLDSAVAYLTAVGIYFLFLMIPIDFYISTEVGPVSQIFANYRQYFALVKSDSHESWAVPMLLLAVWYVAMCVYSSKQNRVLTLFLSVLVLVLSALLAFGLYPALEAPLFDPRAMYGVGALVAFLGVGNPAQHDKAAPNRAASVMLAWAILVFAATYGNALAAQRDYEDFRMEEAIYALTNLEEFRGDSEVKTVQVDGSVGLAPVVVNSANKYRLIRRIVPIQFAEKWDWGIYRFCNYYGLNRKIQCASATIQDYSGYTIVSQSFYHTIYHKDGNFVISLK